MKSRIALDVAHLPTNSFGPGAVTWWGTMGFMTLESVGFALAGGAYLYLAASNQQWPINAPPPDLLPGTLLTVVLLLSAIPNYLLDRRAEAEDLPRVRYGLVVMSILGIAPLIIRAFEFRALNVSWDTNAYGSIVWVLLGLHTAHILTDAIDTLVLTALMFTRHAENPRRFGDVDDNAFYWGFVVLSWLPIYFLIYWVPRL